IGIDGHDICCHGYRWEEHFRLSVEQEADRIARAVDTIRRLTGQPPVGWYCRYGPSPDTRRLVVENGSFLYDSDAYNDDLPYWTKVGDKNHLVIPYALDTNDLKFAPGNNFSTGSSFFEYLRDSFETLAEEGRHWPRMMSI
ncbi:chitin deacetylase, partial [Mesorhizobium sp. M7D.F.Ca.US.004.03.1.1]|uniref:polysaccharide deacetylase family protein n=1 Tax=Mesorhizobium sp. M7D.F.Ca.US.004.03.1.1 TaxID=2496702 RepID=UPI000FD507ED